MFNDNDTFVEECLSELTSYSTKAGIVIHDLSRTCVDFGTRGTVPGGFADKRSLSMIAICKGMYHGSE